MMVNKYTEPIPPTVDPPPVEEVQITMNPQGMRQVRKLAHEVHESRVENRRQFSNIEEILDERDHHLFEELSQLIAHNHHELRTEHRQLRGSIEELLEVLDRHMYHWFKSLQERLGQQADRDGDKLRRSVEARLAKLERDVAASLGKLAQTLEESLQQREEEQDVQQEVPTHFKLGDRINVLVDGVPVDGTGSFVSMNDEVLIWFDSAAQVRFQSLIDSSVTIERA